MSTFEQRLNSLEDRMSRLDGVLQNTEVAAPPRDDRGESHHNIASCSDSSEHVRFRNEISSNAAKVQELPQDEAPTDGMAVTFVNEEDTAFFGRLTKLQNGSMADLKKACLPTSRSCVTLHMQWRQLITRQILNSLRKA